VLECDIAEAGALKLHKQYHTCGSFNIRSCNIGLLVECSALWQQYSDSLLLMQVHIRILESTQENITTLLLGLEYLISISYVDDTEVFKAHAYCFCVPLSPVLNNQIDTVSGLLKIIGLFGLLEFLGVGAV
jgi:hypothetical protein